MRFNHGVELASRAAVIRLGRPAVTFAFVATFAVALTSTRPAMSAPAPNPSPSPSPIGYIPPEPDRCLTSSSTGTDVSVSLNSNALPAPATDLVCDAQCRTIAHNLHLDSGIGPNGVLDPGVAYSLKQAGVDLSKLDPDTSTDFWKGPSSSADESQDNALSIQSWDFADFKDYICSSSGHFRFNIRTRAGGGTAQDLTLMLSKDVHTFLLRKELLRRLGYKVPAMKYLPHVKIKFPDVKTRDFILKYILPRHTGLSAARWCTVSSAVQSKDKTGLDTIPCTTMPPAYADSTDPLEVWFQDVIVMQATPLIFNLAIGPPISQVPGSTSLRQEGPRTLRALSVLYGLADVPESINQFDWYAARQANGTVSLHTPDQANFATTLDDADWMLRRMSSLTPGDISQIVANSYYPEPIAKVLVEKLKARKSSLFKAFSLGTGDMLPCNGKVTPACFDTKVSEPPGLKNGKITQQEWPGWASRFAHGDPQSPLRGLQWYFVSEAQANAMETLISEANKYLPQINQQKDFAAHAQELLQKFITTGQVQKMPIWAAPIVSFGPNISRQVVLGQYLGTNNLVQLADNFGFSATVGLMLASDVLPAWVSAQGLIETTGNITVTHLKPLTSLKSGVTERLSGEIVPLVFMDSAQIFKTIADAQAGASSETPDQLKKLLGNDLAMLDKFLGPGESLILSETLTNTQQLTAGLSAAGVTLAPSVSGSIQGNEILLHRIQFYRPTNNPNMITVFNDSGELANIILSAEFTLGSAAQFPVFSMSAKAAAGSGTSHIYTVNIQPDPNANPALYEGSAALSAALKTGSVDVLDRLEHGGTVLHVDFKDSSSSVQFFHWIRRTLKTDSMLDVALPDGTSGKYITLSEGKQTGSSYQSLAQEAATYLVQRLSGTTTFGVDTQANPNPGQTFLGHSQTRNAAFQGVRVTDPTGQKDIDISNPYVRVQYRWEGWDMSAQDALGKTGDLTAKYGYKVYPDGFLGSTTSVKMYELAFVLNFYQAGINDLLSMTTVTEKAFEKYYHDRHNCDQYYSDSTQMPGDDVTICAALDRFESGFSNYRKGISDPSKKAQVIFQIVTNLEQFAALQDVIRLMGGSDATGQPLNIYVASQITGFRDSSEDLSDPFYSNTLGHSDPDNPTGIVDSVENILGIQDGEFNMSWMRDVL